MQNSDSEINKLLATSEYKLLGENISKGELLNILSKQIVDSNQDGLNLVSLVGGVASGKTTLAKALVSALENAAYITTDDYVKGTREWRRTEVVAKNKSPLEKYDLKLLNQKIEDIKKLKQGEKVSLPKYDPLTGLAVAAGEDKFPKEIGKVETLIVEGDFHFVDDPDQVIYLHVADETRKQNRIARDQDQRGEDDLEKLISDIKTRDQQQHFPYTLPVAKDADIIIVATKNKVEDDYLFTIYIKI